MNVPVGPETTPRTLSEKKRIEAEFLNEILQLIKPALMQAKNDSYPTGIDDYCGEWRSWGRRA